MPDYTRLHQGTCLVTQEYTHGYTRVHAWIHKGTHMVTCLVTQEYTHGCMPDLTRLHTWFTRVRTWLHKGINLVTQVIYAWLPAR